MRFADEPQGGNSPASSADKVQEVEVSYYDHGNSPEGYWSNDDSGAQSEGASYFEDGGGSSDNQGFGEADRDTSQSLSNDGSPQVAGDLWRLRKGMEPQKSSYNCWRRRFFSVEQPEGTVSLQYMSEKAKDQKEEAALLFDSAGRTRAELNEMPVLHMKKLVKQEKGELCHGMHEYQLFISQPSHSTAMEYANDFPDYLYPFSISWKEQKETKRVVLAAQSTEERSAWLNSFKKVVDAEVKKTAIADTNNIVEGKAAVRRSVKKIVGLSFLDTRDEESRRSRKYSSARLSKSSSSIGSGTFTTKRLRSEESSQQITHQVIGDAVTYREEASRLIEKADNLAGSLADKNALVGNALRGKLARRIKTTANFEKALEKRLLSVEPVTYLLGQCIQELERAHRNAWPLMSVAMQRQEIRELCPTGELDKDYLQMSLKYEQKMLAKGRRKVALLKDDCLKMDEELQASIERMREELRKKKSHVAHDKSIVKASIENQPVSKELLKADKTMEPDRVAWGQSVRELLDATYDLEKRAIEYRKESDALMKENHDTALEAAANTQALFKKHTAEMQRLRRLVEKQIEESHFTMSSLEAVVHDTKRQLEKLKQPKKSIETRLQSAQKQSEAVAESGQPRVTLVGAVTSHHDRLLSRYRALEDQLTKSQRLLFDLRNAHEALEEDFHVKSIAMDYSRRCLLVAPEPDEDKRMVDFRKTLFERAVRTELNYVDISTAMMYELRHRFRAAASLGPGEDLDWDLLFDRFKNNKDITEITEDDLRIALRREFKFSREMISDDQVTSFFDILSHNEQTLTIEGLVQFILKEPGMKSVDEFVIPEVEHKRDKLLASQVQRRPSRSIVPVLKASQIASLRKRIRGAAWLATTNQGAYYAGDVEPIFAKFDKNGTGVLEDLDVKKAIRMGLKMPQSKLSDLELWSLIHDMDSSHTGTITLQEFVDWVNADDGHGDHVWSPSVITDMSYINKITSDGW